MLTEAPPEDGIHGNRAIPFASVTFELIPWPNPLAVWSFPGLLSRKTESVRPGTGRPSEPTAVTVAVRAPSSVSDTSGGGGPGRRPVLREFSK